MSWGDGSGVPTSGKRLVIVGTDNKRCLHIRIFNAVGNQVTNAVETELPDKAEAIAILKQHLPDAEDAKSSHRGHINRR